MKCPYCNDGVSRYSAPGFRWPCTICDGTGEVLSNEEWIRICPTHELIRILMSVAEGGAMRKASARDFYEEAQRWDLWLKEVHQ